MVQRRALDAGDDELGALPADVHVFQLQLLEEPGERLGALGAGGLDAVLQLVDGLGMGVGVEEGVDALEVLDEAPLAVAGEHLLVSGPRGVVVADEEDLHPDGGPDAVLRRAGAGGHVEDEVAVAPPRAASHVEAIAVADDLADAALHHVQAPGLGVGGLAAVVAVHHGDADAEEPREVGEGVVLAPTEVEEDFQLVAVLFDEPPLEHRRVGHGDGPGRRLAPTKRQRAPAVKRRARKRKAGAARRAPGRQRGEGVFWISRGRLFTIAA